MPDQSPNNITLGELEDAVASAIAQIKLQKADRVPDLTKEPLLAGRVITWPFESGSQPEAESSMKWAAEQITQQVNAKHPELQATSVVEQGIGRIIIGLIFRNE